MSITPGRGAGSLQRLAFSKYYNVQKWQSKFTLGPNTAKNTHSKIIYYIKVVKHSVRIKK